MSYSAVLCANGGSGAYAGMVNGEAAYTCGDAGALPPCADGTDYCYRTADGAPKPLCADGTLLCYTTYIDGGAVGDAGN